MAAAILCPRSDRFAEDNCHKHNGSEKKHKRGRQKIVTWPMDEKLCEVRHFLADDAPSLIGVVMQDFLHSKQQGLQPAHSIPSKESNYFIGCHPTEAKRVRFTSVLKPDGNVVGIPQDLGLSMAKALPIREVELEALMVAVPWHRADKFIPDDSWLWAGGEESTEVALQQQRELRLLEAFYPRAASVPESPAEPLEKCKQVDDSSVLLIPLISLEEEEMQDVEPVKMTENNHTENIAPEGREITDPLKHGTDALNHVDGILRKNKNPMAEYVKFTQTNLMSEADSNIAAVAAAACMVVKSLGESDLVDEKLLLEILKNPSLLKSLTWSSQVMNKKSQVKNNDTASPISQEPITGPFDKLLPDHGAYLNASPVSVLTRWEEGAITDSPCGTTPVARGSTNIWQPATAILNPITMNPPMPVATSLPSQVSHKTIHKVRDFPQKGFEIATRAIPEICMNSPFNPPNLQGSSFVNAYKPKDEVRLSFQNGLRDNLVNASCSMQSMPAVTPLIGPSAGSTSLSNSELPQKTLLLRDPLLGRCVQDAESKSLQPKKIALGVPPNTGGRGRPKRFCMYFNSPRGCRNGGSCAFLHQSLDSELNTMAL